jgi:hypothetical protein
MKRKRKNPHAVALGRLGGRVRSEAKRRAQPQKWPQGWPGQRPQKTNCRPPQRPTSAPRSPQKIIEVIALIRARFGAGAIGLGHQGIRFAGVPDAHTT